MNTKHNFDTMLFIVCYIGVTMKLKSVWLCIALLSCSLLVVRGYEDIQTLEDDDFAEFEQFEAEDETPVTSKIFNIFHKCYVQELL